MIASTQAEVTVASNRVILCLQPLNNQLWLGVLYQKKKSQCNYTEHFQCCISFVAECITITTFMLYTCILHAPLLVKAEYVLEYQAAVIIKIVLFL